MLKHRVGVGVQFSLRQVDGEVRGDRWGYRPDLAECSNDPNAYVYTARQESKRVDTLLRKGYVRGGPWDELERRMNGTPTVDREAEEKSKATNREFAQAISDNMKEGS